MRTRFAGVAKTKTALIVSTNAAEGICNYAAKENVDLIVLSTHGRTGLAHLLIGSVAEKVVRHAPCPVLTVRAPGGVED
ncbi:MAG: universal stress protein [Sandaracinaceae bacterium]|nr:universal stress protein [Sandaracinaceae bacterium]